MVALIESIVALGLLLLVSCLAVPLAQRLRLPHSVLLAAFGFAVGIIGISTGTLPDALAGNAAGSLQSFGLTAHEFLLLFLPPLLFAAGLQVDVRLLMDEIWAVLLLAVVAVIVTTGVVGVALVQLADFTWVAALLLGAIIATTDPAAVVAVFRDLGATKRLRVIVEGESLLNDAAAIALFGALSVLALPGGEDSARTVAFSALPNFVLGALVGIVVVRVAWSCFALLASSTVVEATFSMLLPYAAYVAAEQGLGASGVVAVAFAGLAMAADGPSRLRPTSWQAILQVWSVIEFVMVSVVFLATSILAARLVMNLSWLDWGLCALVFAAAIVARASVLYGLLPILTRVGLAQPVDLRFRAIILWGGLRGAITLVLALAVMENVSLPLDFRQTVAGIAVGYVCLTLFISAPALRPLLHLLGLDRLSRVEETMRERVLAVSEARRAKHLGATADQLGIPQELVAAANAAVEGKNEEGETAPLLPKTERLDIALVALSTRERWLYLQHFSEQMVSLSVIARLVTSAERLRDSASSGGKEAYNLAASRALAVSICMRRAMWLYRWTKLPGPLERALEDRYEFLLMRRHVLHELQDFAQTTIARFFGEDVGSDAVQILKVREDRVADALQAMTLRFGDYGRELALHQLERTALRLEISEYKARLEESLITQEIYDAQQRRLSKQRTKFRDRPSLELGTQLEVMIRAVQLFSCLDEADIEWVAQRLEPKLLAPGEAVISIGEPGRAVYFTTAGRLDVILPNHTVRLNNGAFFGEMALLQNRPRAATVVSVGYTHLLVLRARPFLKLLKRYPQMRSDIESTVQEREDENRRLG